MDLQIRRIREGEVEAVVRLSLAAWAPVFSSFERVLGIEIFRRQYPDWQSGQRAVVEGISAEQGTTTVWVAEVEGTIAGFIAIELNDEERIGEVQLLAVDPAFQNHGVGTALNEFALRMMDEGSWDAAGRRRDRWRPRACPRQKVLRKGRLHPLTPGALL